MSKYRAAFRVINRISTGAIVGAGVGGIVAYDATPLPSKDEGLKQGLKFGGALGVAMTGGSLLVPKAFRAAKKASVIFAAGIKATRAAKASGAAAGGSSQGARFIFRRIRGRIIPIRQK